MCLELKENAKLQIAKKDITCYKVIRESDDNNFLTPYCFFEVKIGETYTSELVILRGYVYEGLHSFKYLKGAREELKEWNRKYYRIAKCIIPKGSSYYIGDFVNGISYASDKLTYIEIIK